MVKYWNLIKIEYMVLKGRFLAHPFASLRASARNDRALLVNGVRRGLHPRLTPPKKLKVSFRMKRSEMRNLQGEYVEAPS